MPIITLPDGNNIDFPNKVTGLEVAEKISRFLDFDDWSIDDFSFNIIDKTSKVLDHISLLKMRLPF